MVVVGGGRFLMSEVPLYHTAGYGGEFRPDSGQLSVTLSAGTLYVPTVLLSGLIYGLFTSELSKKTLCVSPPESLYAIEAMDPIGPLGFEGAQHRRTPRPSVGRIRIKALRPFGSQ